MLQYPIDAACKPIFSSCPHDLATYLHVFVLYNTSATMSTKVSLGGNQFDYRRLTEESLYHSQYCIRIFRWCWFPTSSPVLTLRWEEPVSFTNVISREARTVRPHLDPTLDHIIEDLSPPAAGCCDSNIDRTLRGIDSSVVSRPVDICNCQVGSPGRSTRTKVFPGSKLKNLYTLF